MPQSLGASAPTCFTIPQDLVVGLFSDHCFAEYHGTRAMLEAEGVIPDGTDWPEGFQDVHWKAGQFDYQLRRVRPEGAKGPRRTFADVDWFNLRWEPTSCPSWEALAIRRKQQELAEAIYRSSAQYVAESNARWTCYWAAQKDAKFQAFKTSIGLVAKRRGRHCKEKSNV